MLTADPKAYGSNWYAAMPVDSPVRPRLNVELDIDICVIGAGLAGLTVALEASKLGRSVVVLEAKSIAWSASGRNPGVVLPGFSLPADGLVQRVGLEQAKALWAWSVAGAEYVRNAARGIEGAALAETGWLHVSKTDDTRTIAHEAALMAGELATPVEPWPMDRVRESLRSERYFHGLYYPGAFSINPLNYALGLAAAAEAAGARIFEDTPVVEIDPAGVRKRVVTGQARVRASQVVLAGNVHIQELMPQFGNTLLPVYSTVIVTPPIRDRLAETIRFAGAVNDEAVPAGHHYRVIDGRLLWCGQSSVQVGNPRRRGDALMRHIRRIYPALDGVKVEHAWVGISGETVHGMPQIGEVSSGVWLMSGFGSRGLATASMAGEMVAHAMVESDETWRMFSAFPLIWAGGWAGRIAQQASEWWRRGRDTIEQDLARRRDAKRRATSVKPA